MVKHSPFIHCTLLEKLSTKSGPNAQDMKAIGRLGKLTELTMGGKNNGITDGDYKRAFEQGQLTGLQRLELRGCRNFGKKATVALFKNCPNLKNWICCQLSQIGGIEEAVTECGASAIKLQKLEMSCTEQE
jgi:hypothetical protein